VGDGTVEFHLRGQGGADGAEPSSDATAAPPAADPPSESSLIGPAEVTARLVGYLAMAVLIGGLLFVSMLWPAGAQETRTRIVLLTSVVAGAAAAVAEVSIMLWRADGSLTLSTVLAEDFGRAHAAMVLLWLLAAVIVAGVVQNGADGVRRLPWRIGALVVGAGLIRLTGMTAHASQGPDPAWGEVADFLHLAAVSAWVGGLVVLTVGVLPRRRLDELEEVVPKFSNVAKVSVLVIVASGLILVWQLIWPIDGIFATHYSRVLVIKLGLFVLVLTAAMASKRWVDNTLTGSVAARRRTAVRSITASVAAETALISAVLGAASVLATSSPGV
jgi:putative copper export protein